MPNYSPQLRDLVHQSLRQRIERIQKVDLPCFDLTDARPEYIPLLRHECGQASDLCSELDRRLRGLEGDIQDFSDMQFAAVFREIYRQSETAELLAARATPREFVTPCMTPAEFRARTGQQLDRETPMFHMLTSEDTARILAVALSAHRRRVELHQKKARNPIEIADIGGGNGFLGKLLVDLARKNRLDIRVTVADPSAASVKWARTAYADTRELYFERTDAFGFALRVNADLPGRVQLLRQRKAYIEEKLFEFEILKNVADQVEDLLLKKKSYPQHFDAGRLGALAGILQDSFGLSINDDGDLLMGEFAERLNQGLSGIHRQMEGSYPVPKFDLILHFSMAPGQDFTREVEMARGAAVIYSTLRGATGYHPRIDGPQPFKEPIWYARRNYRTTFSWTYDESQIHTVEVRPRSDFAPHISCNPETLGLQREPPYCWEGLLQADNESVGSIERASDCPTDWSILKWCTS